MLLATQVKFPATADERGSGRITTIDLPAPAIKTFKHRVTLVNHQSDRSHKIEVTTFSDSFNAIQREVAYVRSTCPALKGYAMADAPVELISGSPF